MGYSYIFWVCILVLTNLYFVFKVAIKVFQLKCIKLYRKYLLKYKPEEFKIHQDERFEQIEDDEMQTKVFLQKLK